MDGSGLSGDPKVWRDILLANREELLTQSNLFQKSLQQLEQSMRSDDAQGIEDFITLASATRAHWRMGAQRSAAD